MIADAKHSRLDALSSAGAMLGLVGVSAGRGPTRSRVCS
jgi:divalent metal cation (Fe/Co/Zn/Cd) transporter